MQLLCPGFIFTNSNLFGPLSASKSKLSSENEIIDVSYVCSQLHAIQQNASHHSIHPNSSRRSIRQDSIHQESTTCQWHKHVPHALILVFDVLPLHEPFGTFVSCGLSFGLSFACFALSSAFTRGA